MSDARSRAHNCLKVFHTICDDYNEGRLVPKKDNGIVSEFRVLQSMTLEAFELFKELHSKEPCDATRAYLIYCGKILLRLSHLIHNDRVETSQEIAEYFKDFNKRYGLHEIR